MRKDMQPLIKLEKEIKGRLMSIKESAAMTRKEEMEEEIVHLEVSLEFCFVTYSILYFQLELRVDQFYSHFAFDITE